MNGLFISLYDITADHVKGIRKKVQAQVKYFGKNCENIDWIYRIADGSIMCNEEKIYNGSNHSKELIYNTLDYMKLKNNISIKKYDFIYIRYLIGNVGLLNFVKYAHKNNVKVLVEIPTYPYLDEIQNNIQGKIKVTLDNYVTKRLKNYISRIVCTNNDDEIFGIKTIKIDNGVDLEETKCISNNKVRDDKFINVIVVASICRWHGYDRFINSMKQYIKDNNENTVRFYLVGGGQNEDINYLKNIVVENRLQDFVYFTGPKDGKELDDLYEKMDFAVSSLALFRAGGGHNPIKTKEYIAKGLPVVTGYEDKIVPSTLEFIYRVSNDESIFKLDKIIEWYKKGNFNVEKIRQYAEEKVSWDSQIKIIINEINNDLIYK